MSRRFLTYETDDAEAGKVNVDETGQLKPSEDGGAGVTWIHMKNASTNPTIYKGKEDAGDAELLMYEDFISAFENGLVILDRQSKTNMGCDLVIFYAINEVTPDGSVKVQLNVLGNSWYPVMPSKGT